MKLIKISNITILFCAVFFTNITLADVAVIVNAGNSLTSLNKNDTKRIFLGKKKKFPGGKKITLVDSAEGTPAREVFYQKVVRKNSAKIKAYWSTMIFSGKGTPPIEKTSDADVISFVKNKDNAIGYVDAAAVTDGVKVVFTIK